jgi:hypothetical protein
MQNGPFNRFSAISCNEATVKGIQPVRSTTSVPVSTSSLAIPNTHTPLTRDDEHFHLL